MSGTGAAAGDCAPGALCFGSTVKPCGAPDGPTMPDTPPLLTVAVVGAGGSLPDVGFADCTELPLPVGGVACRRADALLGSVCGARGFGEPPRTLVPP